MTTDPTPPAFDIDALPELDTVVAMVGTLRGTEVGGSVCVGTGVLVVTNL